MGREPILLARGRRITVVLIHDQATGVAAEVRVADRLSPAAVVILCHGGAEHSRAPAGRHRMTYLRIRRLSRRLRVTNLGVEQWLLRYRYRGWNAPDLPAVADARWAVGQAVRRHRGVPVVLVGHSMGARAALRVADADGVSQVVALAPWLTADDPVEQLHGRTVLIVHGDRDAMTDPRQSVRYAVRAVDRGVDARFVSVAGDGHAMLRHPKRWNRLVSEAVAEASQVTRPGSAG